MSQFSDNQSLEIQVLRTAIRSVYIFNFVKPLQFTQLFLLVDIFEEIDFA